MHPSARQLQKILFPGSRAVASKFTVVVKRFIAPYLIELVHTRICTVYDIHEPLSGNDHQGGVLLWQGEDESRTIGERHGW